MLRSLGGLGEQEAVEVYEEVKFEPTVMVDKLSPTVALVNAQLEDGDILVFQRQLPQVRALPCLPSFLPGDLGQGGLAASAPQAVWSSSLGVPCAHPMLTNCVRS